MTADAVTFDVAAHARSHRQARLSSVFDWPRDPDRGRWVKPLACADERRGDLRDADTGVALAAERLQGVAARASWLVSPCHLRMNGEPIVGVDAWRTKPSVVTIRTIGFGMAACTHASEISSHPAMAHNEILVVMEASEPAGRIEPPFLEARLNKTIRTTHVAVTTVD